AASGVRCNPAKLLIDPYAEAIDGDVDWAGPTTLPYVADPGNDHADLVIDETDSAPSMPKSVVIADDFDWAGDARPRHRWDETVIYEVHVKGFTATHSDVPEELRGTYAGMAHPAAIQHLVDLGVTAVELLPVHHFVSESFLAERGLTNYWGYSSIGFFAPHADYSASGTAGEQVREFKQLVRALHAADIEVILDVVYNHTAEGNHLGPMLSLKGIDNPAYYRLSPDDPHYYFDVTGTGNSLNPVHPASLRLIMDSLRHWVTEFHVDGFRFDLASALARGFSDFDRLGTFLGAIHQDPILSQVKLIAEPWDVGADGYRVGGFPALWSEWNGIYRDDVRDIWRGEGHFGDLATRLSGSPDLYGDDGRRPFASINFVTAHDGFTLRDLVSYDGKHNEANLEDNQDGTDDNSSWNCGVEGPTDDPDVNELRARQQRNLLATLLLSQGVPMLVGGDELGRTQGGNNNGWCQDNETSWFDWGAVDGDLLEFTKRLIALRRGEPVFHRREFLRGDQTEGDEPDVAWFAPSGERMGDEEWGRGRAVGMFVNGDEIPNRTRRGHRVQGDSFLVLINTGWEPVSFTLPEELAEGRFRVELVTGRPVGEEFATGDVVELQDRSIVVLRRVD
ncbi:MAG: glgX, partial [Thermoleophilia bacterium]|nr:glgX [Thermoleophilia bacterium]